ncbi:MAG: DAK2 domain-containing protein [Chloroflexia bacterium]
MTIDQHNIPESARPTMPSRPASPTGPGETWSGDDLKLALAAASVWLGRNIEVLNALNVFPVPDGDTGTNMALTMQAAVKQVAALRGRPASEVASGVSHGALMGARGNSGVILSQIFRGFAEGIAGKESISARDFAAGLAVATVTAYRAVLKPVEGTILTVIRELSEGAQAAAQDRDEFGFVLAETAKAAKESVARTPTLLDKLREAGVVDAGGQGLYMIMDALSRFVAGEDLSESEVAEATGSKADMDLGHAYFEHGEYGYCTNFMVSGTGWDFDQVREKIAAMGDSAVIVGDDRLVKVHIHTEMPGSVLDYACGLGSLSQISIANMQDQHDEFIEMHLDGADGTKPNGAGSVDEPPPVAQGRIAVLAVASGAGLVKTFRSMGATAIIEGGQTMKPSTEDLLKAIEKVPQDEVILLPNNGNIIPSARQTQSLTTKQVAVVPTDTMPQGMAALIALNYEASLEENARTMEAAASRVQTGEVTRAVRDASVQGIAVKSGDIIGLLNNSLVATGSDRDEVALDLLQRMEAADLEFITIYSGGDLDAEVAEAFRDRVQEHYTNAEVELVDGGQPFYDYIISAE